MKKIIVVDDEFIVRVGFKSIINWEEFGYTIVAEASSGFDALEKIERLRPDIVLTDLMMDGMDGFELISRCGKLYPRIRFVVLSSYNDFDNVRHAMKLGARDYIFKLTAKPGEIIKILDEIGKEQDADSAVTDDSIDTLVLKNMQAIKKSLFNRCVHLSYSDDEDILSQFHSLGMRLDLEQPFVLLYYNIDGFTKSGVSRNGKDDLQLIKFSMENIAAEVLAKNWQSEVFNGERSVMTALVNTGEHTEQGDLYPLLEADFLKIHSYYKQYLGFSVSGAVSPILHSVRDIPKIFRCSEDTLRCRRGGSHLCHFEDGERPEITKTKEYVNQNLRENLNVTEVAKLVGMSESYFSHIFKKETGLSYVDYVNRVRVEYAALLLDEGSYKVSDIARQVGIENPNYFSVLFKKVMGVSPNAYKD